MTQLGINSGLGWNTLVVYLEKSQLQSIQPEPDKNVLPAELRSRKDCQLALMFVDVDVAAS